MRNCMIVNASSESTLQAALRQRIFPPMPNTPAPPKLFVAKNLRWLMARRKTNANAVAEATGVQQSTIHRMLTGNTADPRTGSLKPVADYLSVSIDDIRYRDLEADAAAGRPNVAPVTIGTTKVPLISYIAAGQWKEMTEAALSDAAADYLLTDRAVSKFAFALEIRGDSMQPEFREGDHVIIDPDVRPTPGDFVAARNGNVEATFKKYRPRGMNATGVEVFELVPLNPDYPTLRSDIEHIEIIGTMVEHRRYRRARR